MWKFKLLSTTASASRLLARQARRFWYMAKLPQPALRSRTHARDLCVMILMALSVHWLNWRSGATSSGYCVARCSPCCRVCGRGIMCKCRLKLFEWITLLETSYQPIVTLFSPIPSCNISSFTRLFESVIFRPIFSCFSFIMGIYQLGCWGIIFYDENEQSFQQGEKCQ